MHRIQLPGFAVMQWMHGQRDRWWTEKTKCGRTSPRAYHRDLLTGECESDVERMLFWREKGS